MENLLILSVEYKEQLEIGDELERSRKKGELTNAFKYFDILPQAGGFFNRNIF